MAETARIGRAGLTLATGTLVSRVLGFVSQAVLSWAIGTNNTAASAFGIANTLPNNIFLLISGGLLSAVLVPQIVRAATHADGGDRFVGRLLSVAVLVFAAVTVVAVAAAPLLVRLYASGDEGGQLGAAGIALATAFAYWCLPQVFFYALFSLLGEVLNARGVFGPATWVPAINNVIAISAAIAFVAVFGRGGHGSPASWGPGEVALIGGGATLGVVVQTIGLILFWRRTGLHFRPGLSVGGLGLGGAGRAAVWTFGMIVAGQLAGLVQNRIATLPEPGDPSIRAIQLAWLLFILPHSLITMSIAAPYFTRMSGHAHSGDTDALRADLSASLRTVTVLVAGSAAAIAAASIPLGVVLAGSDAGVGVAGILLAYLVALVPFSALFLVQRTFFALGDTRTPFFIQLLQSGLFVLLALIVAELPSDRIAIGIALATSLSLVVQLVVSVGVLRRRIHGIDGARLIRRVGVFLLLTIPAAAAGIGVLALLGGLPGGGDGFALSDVGPALISAAAVGATSGVVYVALLGVSRAPELRQVIDALPLRRS